MLSTLGQRCSFVALLPCDLKPNYVGYVTSELAREKERDFSRFILKMSKQNSCIMEWKTELTCAELTVSLKWKYINTQKDWQWSRDAKKRDIEMRDAYRDARSYSQNWQVQRRRTSPRCIWRSLNSVWGCKFNFYERDEVTNSLGIHVSRLFSLLLLTRS